MVLFTKKKVYTGSISSERKNISNEVEKKWRRNTFLDKQILKESITSKLTLNEMIKEVL